MKNEIRPGNHTMSVLKIFNLGKIMIWYNYPDLRVQIQPQLQTLKLALEESKKGDPQSVLETLDK